jgi:hypothetical protein
LYSSPNIIKSDPVKDDEMDRACSTHGEKRNAYKVLVGKLEAKRPLGRPRGTWEDNIKVDLREIGWSGMDWIHLVEDRDLWSGLVNTVMNLRASKMLGISGIAERLAASQGGVDPMGLFCYSIS